MPRLTFTANLKRHVECPSAQVTAATVREALEAYFVDHPAVRSYVFDEQGELRRHVVIFIDGEQLKDRARQQDAVLPSAEVYVMQALSGG